MTHSLHVITCATQDTGGRQVPFEPCRFDQSGFVSTLLHFTPKKVCRCPLFTHTLFMRTHIETETYLSKSADFIRAVSSRFFLHLLPERNCSSDLFRTSTPTKIGLLSYFTLSYYASLIRAGWCLLVCTVVS